MICIPLIESGIQQTSDQYNYSQFETVISSIDNGISMVLNSTGQKAMQEDLYVPSTVVINSSLNVVNYYFLSSSITKSISRNYPMNVDIAFGYGAGWFSVNIFLQNSTWIKVSFAFKTSS
jgi:hypothetical protein